VVWVSLLVPRFVEYAENTSSKEHTLIRAVQAEDATIVRLLLMSGADTEARDKHIRMTPLEYAATTGKTKFARILLDAGADPNGRKSWAIFPPVLRAAAGQDREMADILVAHGADYTVEAALLLGDTGFSGKAFEENPEILGGTAFFGGSILSLAVHFDRVDVARYLLELGLDPTLDTVRMQGATLRERVAAWDRHAFGELFEPYYSTDETVSERIGTVN
jgi:ankyrin repeat protein